MITPLRLVLDTNVVLSALLWAGKPAQLLRAAVTQAILLCSSQKLVDELGQSLGKPKFVNRIAKLEMTTDDLADIYLSLAVLVEHGALAKPASRDPDDNFVLACALAAGADVIVSGDNDLLVLGAWQGIAIMTVSESLELVAALTDRSGGALIKLRFSYIPQPCHSPPHGRNRGTFSFHGTRQVCQVPALAFRPPCP